MGKALKDLFDLPFFHRFSEDLQLVLPNFNESAFVAKAMDDSWEGRSYKQRIMQIARVLGDFLPMDYAQAVCLILRLLDEVEARLPDTKLINDKHFNLFYLEYGAVLDSFIEQFGLDHFDTSIKAIEHITQLTTCEFVTHAFILRYPEAMMQQMLRWATHEHWAVRRLASEGCRPRLPWAVALPCLKQDPAPILPILELLKNDPSRFVRLSVANNLNDIAKDNPEVVIALAQQWWGENKAVNWIIKHGCRTLIKQGNIAVLKLLGIAPNKHISIKDFCVLTPNVRVGDHVAFQFQLTNSGEDEVIIRLAYALYYLKANGTLSKKVYRLSEKVYPPQTSRFIVKEHALRVVTTRTLHPGIHQLSIIANGQESEQLHFKLIE